MKRIFRLGSNLLLMCLCATVLPGCGLLALLSGAKDNDALVAESIKVAIDDRTEVRPGTTSAYPVNVTVAGGSGFADLTIASTQPQGVTATLSRATVRDPYTLTFQADSTAVPGQFLFTLSAVDPGGTNKTPTTSNTLIKVEKPFTIGAGGVSGSTLGVPQSIDVSVARLGRFTQPITLSVLQNTVPVNAIMTPMKTVVSGATSTMQLTLPVGLNVGRYLTRVVGTFGAYVDTVSIFYEVFAAPIVPDITITATPSVSIAPGGSAVFDIGLVRSAPGIPNIDLSVNGLPTGATPTFNPASVPVTTGSSHMTVATLPSLADGTYPLTITATAGTLVKTATVSLVVVTPPSLTMTVAPTALTVARSATGQVTATFQSAGAVGPITVDVPTALNGVTVVANPTTVNGSGTRTSVVTFAVSPTATPGTFPVTVRGTAGSIVRTANVSLTIPAPPPSDLAIQLLTPTVNVPLGGTIQIPIKLARTNTAVGQLIELTNTAMSVGGSAWISPSSTTGDSATLYIIGGSVGPASVVVSAVFGTTPPTAVATVNVTATTAPDFSVTPAPATLNLSAGASQQMAIVIGRTNNFAGAVSFVAIGDAPGNFNVTFSLNSTTGTGIGMTVQAAPGIAAGPHTLTIRGTSGTTVREVTMTVIIGTGGSPYPYPYYPFGIKRPPPE